MKTTLVLGGLCGLVVSGGILTLLWFGFSGLLIFGHTNLRHMLWPSFIMLTNGWRSTPAGIMITISSVAINCLLYGVAALSVHLLVRFMGRWLARN